MNEKEISIVHGVLVVFRVTGVEKISNNSITYFDVKGRKRIKRF